MANFVHRTYNMTQKVNALSFNNGLWTFRKSKGAVNFYADANFAAPDTCVTVTYSRKWTDGFCVGEGLASQKMKDILTANESFIGFTEYTDKNGRHRTSPAMVFFCSAASKTMLIEEIEEHIRDWESRFGVPTATELFKFNSDKKEESQHQVVQQAPEPSPYEEMDKLMQDFKAALQLAEQINTDPKVESVLNVMKALLGV